MNDIIESLHRHARARPGHAAIVEPQAVTSYAELVRAVARTVRCLRNLPAEPRAIGIAADNGSAWAIADLAALVTGIPVVPIPLFFSPTQIRHALSEAGVTWLLTDRPQQFKVAIADMCAHAPTESVGHGLVAIRLACPSRPAMLLPAATQKLTFTSGTTGEPKGVCLGVEALQRTAEALSHASAANADDRHLCVLPLATLLENVAGIYTPLLVGATICLPPLADVGLSGSSQFDAMRLMAALNEYAATSAILVPQMLQAIVHACRSGASPPPSLRYIAVGGAPVSPKLLREARAQRLPVYEGYGLSECGSVVAVNRPDADRPGSVGRPLPHVQLSFAADGEILVCGSGWHGYLGARGDSGESHTIATGDLGYLDDAGFLHLTGRKKNVFVTSFGRNVAPEWVECELVAHAPIMQAAIFGEARPYNTAVIFHHPAASDDAIGAALQAANARLPDYAQAQCWIRAPNPFSVENGMSTANGRLRREAIFDAYAAQINALYDS